MVGWVSEWVFELKIFLTQASVELEVGVKVEIKAELGNSFI